MTKEKKIQITEDFNDFRLDQVLSHFLKSRMQASRLIKEGKVKLENSDRIKPSHRVVTGDFVTVLMEEEKNTTDKLEPYDFPVPIIYEDSELLVVNKPAGLVVHPSHGHPNDTLVNALIHKLNPESCVDPMRPGLLHRLDKEVSGLLVLSKKLSAHHFLAQQFESKQINRTYWGLCYPPILSEEGKIESYLKRNPIDRKKFISDPEEGKKAITHFKILKKSDLILVEFQLQTGRTHQIRIHSREFSQGIAGDLVYSAPKALHRLVSSKLIQKIQNLNRIALHATYLSFIHPKTNKLMTFHCPFPEELENLKHIANGTEERTL